MRISILRAQSPFKLRMRTPRWASADGQSDYRVIPNVKAGDVFEFELPFTLRATRYTGGEELPHAERWALERGPLLYAAMGAPNPVRVRWDTAAPGDWFTPDGDILRLRGDACHEYRPYKDIFDEPFSVYPIVEAP